MRLVRFAVGRWLIHLGLRTMPQGHARREIHNALTICGLRIMARNAANGYAALAEIQKIGERIEPPRAPIE